MERDKPAACGQHGMYKSIKHILPSKSRSCLHDSSSRIGRTLNCEAKRAWERQHVGHLHRSRGCHENGPYTYFGAQSGRVCTRLF